MENVAEPRPLALTVMGVLGATAGYLLLLALAGGRYDSVGQCFTQADGLTSCYDSIPRSYWVDVAAAVLGALATIVATIVVARRAATSEGSSFA